MQSINLNKFFQINLILDDMCRTKTDVLWYRFDAFVYSVIEMTFNSIERLFMR